MTLKSLATGVAAAAIAVAATAGVTSVASPVALAAPVAGNDILLPMEPVADVPTSDQLLGVLNGLGAPGVSFRNKGQFVEGGLGLTTGSLADRYFKDKYPLVFNVGTPVSTGPGVASAPVTASGTGFGPYTADLTFVNQGGWKLSKASVDQLIALAS